MIASLKEKTGRTLEEWKSLIDAKGLTKHSEVIAFLKGDHGISHGYANQIALRHKEVGAPPNEANPLDEMFEKRADVRPIYDALVAQLQAFGPDVDLAPKKAYVSVRRKKQFAILQPAASRLDVGINLPGEPAGTRLELSGSFNSMVSHRVKVASLAEADDELIGWLRLAYERAG